MAFEDALASSGFLGAILALGAIVFIIVLALYIYVALATMRIAKKTGTEPAWLAWIPIANLYLMSQMAGMHWWPVLLVIGTFIPIIGFFAGIALSVFGVIWWWKIFEKIGRPGWWSIFQVIPFVNVVFLVFLGIAAWGEGSTPAKGKRR